MRLIPIYICGVTASKMRAFLLGIMGLCTCTIFLLAAKPMLAFADDAPKVIDARQKFLTQVLPVPVSGTVSGTVSGIVPVVVPTPKVLWLTPDVKKDMKKILKHEYAGLRVRYWQDISKTDKTVRRVWILDEVGKYKPITVGIVVKAGSIEKIQVLEYRESHGWEVKHDFFTQQFIGATLPKQWKLDRRIDGISGATLSVRALKKLAMLGLYLDSVASQNSVAPQKAEK